MKSIGEVQNGAYDVLDAFIEYMHNGLLVFPTHSVAAFGKDAEDFVAGEEQWDTPCTRHGCWGKLYDRKAKALFIGCSPLCNVSDNYGKIEEALLYTEIAHKGLIGDALSLLCDVKRMVDLTTSFLQRNPDLFGNNNPVLTEWYA